MKRILAVAGLATAMTVTGCQKADDAKATEETPAAAEAATDAAAAADAPLPAAVAPSARVEPAAPGAPVFAVIYPGGAPKRAAVVGQSPAGPGGILEFTTEATPEAVIDFYRQRAEAAGLKPINALNSDAARAYSAGDGANGSGKLLSVIATPVDGGLTDVQLNWSNGR